MTKEGFAVVFIIKYKLVTVSAAVIERTIEALAAV
jgi:hypothetical protein